MVRSREKRTPFVEFIGSARQAVCGPQPQAAGRCLPASHSPQAKAHAVWPSMQSCRQMWRSPGVATTCRFVQWKIDVRIAASGLWLVVSGRTEISESVFSDVGDRVLTVEVITDKICICHIGKNDTQMLSG